MRRLVLLLVIALFLAAIAYFGFVKKHLEQEAAQESTSVHSSMHNVATTQSENLSAEEQNNANRLVQPLPDEIEGVRFPDGEIIAVHLRERSSGVVIPGESSPDLSLLVAYELLVNAVDDDPSAAFKLFELQRHCGWIQADTSGVGFANPNDYVGPWGMTLVHDGSGQQVADVQLAAKRHLEECVLLNERGFNDTDWLRTAADLGSSEAFKQLGYQLGNTRAAVEVFEQAWQAGEIYATSWLSHIHTKGFTSEDGQFLQDTTQAFANQYLFASLLSLKYANRGGSNQPFARVAWAEVERMQNGLHPHELDEAYKIAKSLLHDKCCLR